MHYGLFFGILSLLRKIIFKNSILIFVRLFPGSDALSDDMLVSVVDVHQSRHRHQLLNSTCTIPLYFIWLSQLKFLCIMLKKFTCEWFDKRFCSLAISQALPATWEKHGLLIAITWCKKICSRWKILDDVLVTKWKWF